MDLRRKVWLITGATSGIGEECAAELAGLGATVVLGARSSQRAAATLARIKARFPDADVQVGPPLNMAEPESIRAFAAEWERSGRPLHGLLNNAGALTFSKEHNSAGVAQLCQVNYLGPYMLTRLLEGVLVRSAPSRVVNVSSLTHRMGVLGDPATDFLRGDQGHFYENTKLANVLHAYETQRRLGRYSVQACAVDPGSVATSIWRGSWLANKITNVVWAPPSVGARPLVFAATVPWGAPTVAQAEGERPPELRYYAPAAFALPMLLWYSPEGNHGWLGRQLLKHGLHASTLWGAAKQVAFLVLGFSVSGVDWPVRQLSGGRLLNDVVAVRSSPLSCDPQLAAALWDASADAAGLPREPQLPGAEAKQ